MKAILSIDPVKYPLTGIGRYTYELARQLQQHPTIDRLYLLDAHRFLDHLPEPRVTPHITHMLRRQMSQSRLAVTLYEFLVAARERRGRWRGRAMRRCQGGTDR